LIVRDLAFLAHQQAPARVTITGEVKNAGDIELGE
jgi:hypothetical protein